MSSDRWIKCISTQGNIRGVAIQATDLVQDVIDKHQVKGVYARGLGESLIGALLLSSYCKAGQRINLNIQGDGHFQQALVDAYPDGRVRGYIVEREASVIHPEESEGTGPWGNGLLSVLRTKDEAGSPPYIGTVPLLTGHLAKDLSFYWVQSEQIPSAVGLVVAFEAGKVKAAGGFLVQALPGASSAEIKLVERHISEIESLADSFVDNHDPMKLLAQVFQSTAFVVVEEKDLKFQCNCSWDRVQRALVLVGPQELRAMLTEDNFAVVRCDFCTKEYQVDAAKLQELIDMSQGKG